jgi:hypothetical protein
MSATEAQTDYASPDRRWYQIRRRTLLVVTAVLAVLLVLAFHYRTHLVFRLVTVRGSLRDVKAVPTSRMPDTPKPKGWVPCQFGSLSFDLPPEMAANVETPANGAPCRVFRSGSKSVVVNLPEDTRGDDRFLQTNLKLPPEGQGISRPRLRLACCQVSLADFRWSMSQNELRWHAWRLAMSGLYRVNSGGGAETLFRDDLDEIVLLSRDRHCAILDCQASRAALGAFIYFKDSSSDLEMNWVRCVCRSARFTDEPNSEKQSSQEKRPHTHDNPSAQ